MFTSILNHRLYRSSLVVNLFSVGGATVISRLISLLILGYPARILGPENYGLIGFGTSVTAYAGIILFPGLLTWGARHIARDRDKVGETLVIVYLTRLVLALVAYSSIVAYALFALNNQMERSILLLCGLSVFNTALSVDWVFNGLELMRIPAWLGVLVSLTNVVALFSFIHSPEDVLIYALFSPLLGLLTVGISFYILSRKQLTITMPCWSSFKVSLFDSIPLGVMMSVVIILHYANNLIVKHFLGTAALGIFMSAFFLFELASTIPNMLGSVFQSRLTRFVTSSKEKAISDAGIFAKAHIVLAFFVSAVMFAEAPTIIALLYGPKYTEATELLRYMAVGVIFNYAICGYTNCLISFGRDRVMLAVVIVSAIISIVGGLILVPQIGAVGAAIVIAAIDFGGWAVSLPYYKRTIGSLHFFSWIRPAIGATLMVTCSLLLQQTTVPMFFRIILCMLCYVPFVFHEVQSALRVKT